MLSRKGVNLQIFEDNGFVTAFTGLLKFVITNKYIVITISHNLQFTKWCNKSSHSTVSSPVTPTVSSDFVLTLFPTHDCPTTQQIFASSSLNWTADSRLDFNQLKVKIILWPTVCRPVYLDLRNPSGNRDQIFNFFDLAHSFWDPSPMGHITIFHCLRFETSSTWTASYVYLFSAEWGKPGYTPRHWVCLIHLHVIIWYIYTFVIPHINIVLYICICMYIYIYTYIRTRPLSIQARYSPIFVA
jgi:hypothetical protein